jgi:hypothetical protein
MPQPVDLIGIVDNRLLSLFHQEQSLRSKKELGGRAREYRAWLLALEGVPEGLREQTMQLVGAFKVLSMTIDDAHSVTWCCI